MKNRVKWMAFVVIALVSAGALAVFDPDADPNLEFNLNFENNPTATTTVDAVAGFVGQVIDYNAANPSFNMWKSGSVLGTYCGDFNAPNDNAPGPSDGNDCSIKIPGSTGSDIFEFGDGWPGNEKTTFAFWFNMPNATTGSFFRHDCVYDAAYWWDVHAYSGKLEFRHSLNCLRFETTDSLVALGVTNNTWHHAVIVIDRTTRTSSKMYIDGLLAPTTVTYYNTDNMNLDIFPWYDSPLRVGTGSREFEGFLDELRIYKRILSPLDVSLLYQWNPGAVHTTAILPIPRSSNVSIATDVNWIPSTGAAAQSVYFGTDPCSLELKATGDGSLNKVTNATLGGQFPLNTKYYWYVKSTIGGVDSNSPVWSFTTETGKAFDPSPTDGMEDVDVSDVNLVWTGSASALSYDVYYSSNRALVEANDISVRIANDITVTNVADVNTSTRSEMYYWRIVSNYLTGTVAGDIWSFRTRPYELIFNTRNGETSYQDGIIPAYTCMLHSVGWSTIATGSLDADANMVIFNFPSGFNYNRRYDITVVPAYRGQDIDSITIPRPLGIHVTGDFYFDGRIRIAGDDVLLVTNVTPRARSGGFVGPRPNSGTTGTAPDSGSWTSQTVTAPYYNRFNNTTGTTSTKPIYFPNSKARSLFGPGIGVNPPYKGGGGGGAGGNGGNCGRGYFFGVFAGGYSYGDKEVPIPFGGSGGGWGAEAAGTSGGGGIEIIATGNVVLDSNSEIRANGGNALYDITQYPGGGGGGGSVKIIAGGSFTNNGAINVSGGQGGNTSKQANEAAGGGGGGRVAIFYGTTYSNTGVITARGGGKGVYGATGLTSLAEDGQSGTIFVANSSVVSPKKASAPTPKNGDEMVYCSSDPCTIQLKWYSGYGATTDVVYCDTNPTPTTARGTVSATRAQHSVNMSVSPNNTYYIRVITDGSIVSDVWSFKTVDWQCPVAVVDTSSTLKYIAGPTWDYNHDCVLNFEDMWYFAKDWRIEQVSGSQNYTLDGQELGIIINEWLECINRTNGGCAGW